MVVLALLSQSGYLSYVNISLAFCAQMLLIPGLASE